MYKRYYDGYARNYMPKDKGEIIVPESLPVSSKEDIKPEITSSDCEITTTSCDRKNSLLSLPCELDDIVLIGILLFLLFDKKKDDDSDNDIFMLLIIGFVLFSDIL